MKQKMKIKTPVSRIVATAVLALLAAAPAVRAQAINFRGTITAISSNSVTVKPDMGDPSPRQFAVSDSAVLQRVEPGQTNLKDAVAMKFADLAVGDRVLVRLDPSASTPTAARIIAIKPADIAQKQKKDEEDWQRRGIAGLVKSVDGTGAIVVATGAGPTAKNVTVQTTGATILKRYAPGSVRFADAQPAPITDIHPGDQLRARGDKSADGSSVAAEEVVSGTFRNVAGTILSIDTAGSSLTVKDLATKKPVTIHIGADVQMRRIPDRMAQMLAARLKGAGTYAAGGQRNWSGGTGGGAPSGAPGGQRANGQGAGQNAAPGGGAPGSPSGGMANGAGNGDPQRFLSMAPAIKLADLQKGEAIMVVTTEGAGDVNAITLLAGVEPLLEAPAATDLLSNWSMGGGGAEAAAGTP